ncbi:hypothetical protein RB195_013948 [Necator americanus]|uniref:HTH psq-type domain-containing protein n=1 Tax=Necator americanus TaxID=51031 RepID=A0ABR1DXW0_NECAM
MICNRKFRIRKNSRKREIVKRSLCSELLIIYIGVREENTPAFSLTKVQESTGIPRRAICEWEKADDALSQHSSAEYLKASPYESGVVRVSGEDVRNHAGFRNLLPEIYAFVVSSAQRQNRDTLSLKLNEEFH